MSAARTIVAIDPNGSHSFTAASQPGSCCAGNTTGLNPNITKISVVASSCAVIGWVTPCAMARPMSTPVRQVNSMAGTTMGVMVRSSWYRATPVASVRATAGSAVARATVYQARTAALRGTGSDWRNS